ncbi:MAG: polysaccharide pyruvyl transferase family protein [Bacteroidia bacterium]
MSLAENLHEIKKTIKQSLLLLKHGLPYIKWSSLKVIPPSFSYNRSKPNILWIGAFPARHRNVGDHAQTVAVLQFFKKHFPEYHVIRMNRNQVKKSKSGIKKLGSQFNEQDLVIMHSSGDFGSQHYNPEGCWHLTRKEIVNSFPKSQIVNLPTTVIYDESPSAQQLLKEDTRDFGGSNFMLLCRENVSLSYVKDVFSSRNEFFPDFVFYLQRPEATKKRNGALVILRSDSEAKLGSEQRADLIATLKKSFNKVDDVDILNADFPVTELVEENYVSHIQDVYEKYELVITDRMHGMILAVTTNTPCLALDSGIPHKINAYESFLAPAVTFFKGTSFNKEQFQEVINSRSGSPDLSEYYNGFRSKVVKT